MFIFQLGVDIGSSTVARGVVSLVLGYLNKLVIEMAFLVQVKPVSSSDVITLLYLVKNINFIVQANTEEELPEYLLGTCRLNHLDASKSVPVVPQS